MTSTDLLALARIEVIGAANKQHQVAECAISSGRTTSTLT